jgi:diphthamide biosynthesis protein 2
VDELAAQHIEGDAVIHFGHACLSPTSRLPVLYIFPKANIDLDQFTSVFIQHCNRVDGSILLLYDVAFSHLIGNFLTIIMFDYVMSSPKYKQETSKHTLQQKE